MSTKCWLEQINEQKDVAVTTLNAPSLAEICLAVGRRQQEDNLIKKKAGRKFLNNYTKKKQLLNVQMSSQCVSPYH